MASSCATRTRPSSAATNPSFRITAPRSVLILKPSSLGDVVQALPVLRLIKKTYPESRVYWWISSDLAGLLEHDPDLTGIISFQRRRWASPANWIKLVQSVIWVRRQQFDWVIDLQSLLRSALFAWAAGGRLTIGLDDCREGASAFYDLVVARPSYDTHAVEWYLAVAQRLGLPMCSDIEWLPPGKPGDSTLRQKWPITDGTWIMINPSARWQNKRWPIDHFQALLRELAVQVPNARFAILGGNEDRELGRKLVSQAPDKCLDLTGKTSLLELIAWMRRAAVLVTNDTGPMHVGAALNLPVVALFGPTDPRRTGPYNGRHEILRHPLPCAPCMKDTCHHQPFLECLTAITPQQVARVVMAFLDKKR
jgi:heptosyltransferase I